MRNPFALVQLPDDVQAQGYRQTAPFHYEQVFFSPSLGFEGTESQFVEAGHGYNYIQIDRFTRVSINNYLKG